MHAAPQRRQRKTAGKGRGLQNQRGHIMARHGARSGHHIGNPPLDGGANAPPPAEGVAAAGGLAAGSGALQRLSHHLGAKHQGRGAEPRRAAGHRHPGHRRASQQGSRLHHPHAGDRERRLAQSLPVAVQRHRLRRCQHHLHEIPGRAGHPADHPAEQGEALGPDDPALHPGHLSGRTRGVEARRRTLHRGVRRRSRLEEFRRGADRVAHRRPP